jgi:hypothetical protein
MKVYQIAFEHSITKKVKKKHRKILTQINKYHEYKHNIHQQH